MPDPDSKKYRLAGDRSITLTLTDEDKRVLGGALVSEVCAGMEVLYAYEVPERMERLTELRALQREKVADKAQEWVDRKRSQGDLGRLSPEYESLLQQAFLAGWRSAPLGPRAIRP